MQKPEPGDSIDLIDEWKRRLCSTFPRDSIPPKLTLKSGYSYQPPRFLYGWAMEQPVLCAIGKHCGFAEEAEGQFTRKATVKLKKILSEKLPRVIEALGWVVIHPILIYEDGEYKELQCIALADSWITGNRKPSAEHVQILREFFHIGEEDIKPVKDEPAWWTDMIAPYWHYSYKKDDLRYYRPWELQPRATK